MTNEELFRSLEELTRTVRSVKKATTELENEIHKTLTGIQDQRAGELGGERNPESESGFPEPDMRSQQKRRVS